MDHLADGVMKTTIMKEAKTNINQEKEEDNYGQEQTYSTKG